MIDHCGNILGNHQDVTIEEIELNNYIVLFWLIMTFKSFGYAFISHSVMLKKLRYG